MTVAIGARRGVFNAQTVEVGARPRACGYGLLHLVADIDSVNVLWLAQDAVCGDLVGFCWRTIACANEDNLRKRSGFTGASRRRP